MIEWDSQVIVGVGSDHHIIIIITVTIGRSVLLHMPRIVRFVLRIPQRPSDTSEDIWELLPELALRELRII